MGTLTVQSFITRLQSSMRDLDAGQRRWTDDDVIQYVSDGQRAAVQLRPEINPVTAVVQLAAGTKQSIPATAFNLLNVIRNMGADMATPGRAIRYADLDDMNTNEPDWHSNTANVVVRNYLYDAKMDRRMFYVWPQQPAAGQGSVEMMYSKIPSELTATTDMIELDDLYQPVLWYYILFRAYNKEVNVEGVSIDARAERYYTTFIRELMGGRSAETILSPAFQTHEAQALPTMVPGVRG